MSLLLYGALNYEITDWDVGITVLMGALTYLMAPWSVTILISAVRYRLKHWYIHALVAILAALFVVDWVYMLYHSVAGNQIYREANLYASMPLYFLAGAFWLYRGTLKEFVNNVGKLF